MFLALFGCSPSTGKTNIILSRLFVSPLCTARATRHGVYDGRRVIVPIPPAPLLLHETKRQKASIKNPRGGPVYRCAVSYPGDEWREYTSTSVVYKIVSPDLDAEQQTRDALKYVKRN